MGQACTTHQKKESRFQILGLKETDLDYYMDHWHNSHIQLIKNKYRDVIITKDPKNFGLTLTGFLAIFRFFKNFPERIAKSCFELFNIHNTGRIDFKEFCSALSLICFGKRKLRTKILFLIFDVDMDGILNARELETLIKYCFSYIDAESAKERKPKGDVNPLHQRYSVSNFLNPMSDILPQLSKSLKGKKLQEELEKQLNKATSLKEKKSILITKKQRQLLDDLLKKNNEDMKVDQFMKWSKENFQLDEFLLNFELVPLPTTESAVILDIMQRADAQSQVADVNWYVLSYPWWELWRSYIHNDFNKIASLKAKYHKGKKNKKGKEEKNIPIEQKPQINPNESALEIPIEFEKPDLEEKVTTRQFTVSGQGAEDDDHIITNKKYNQIIMGNEKEEIKDESGGVKSMFKTEVQKISKDIMNYSPTQNHHDVNGKSGKKDIVISNFLFGDRPGPVDNFPIEGEYPGTLKMNIIMNQHYVIIPKTAWRKLYSFYKGGPIFKRKVYMDDQRNSSIFELYPIYLTGILFEKNGGFKYDTSTSLILTTRITIHHIITKLSKKINFPEGGSFNIYMRNVGEKEEEPWRKIEDKQATLTQLKIKSGSFMALVLPQDDAIFNNTIVNKKPIFDPSVKIELGDVVDVFQLTTKLWKKAILIDSDPSKYKFHFLKESYHNRVWIPKSKDKEMIAPVNTRSLKNQIEKRYEEEEQQPSQLPPYLKDVYFMGKTGLFNLGNTCYINSIVQCILHTPLLKQYFLLEVFKNDLSKKLKSTLTEQLYKVSKDVFNPNDNGPIWPDDLKTRIVDLMPMFEGSEQHDAQEFLGMFQDCLINELKKDTRITKQLQKNNMKKEINYLEKEKLKANVEYQSKYAWDSVIQEIFMGQTRTTFICPNLQCKFIKHKFEDFQTLSLPIPVLHEYYINVQYIKRCDLKEIPKITQYGTVISKFEPFSKLSENLEKLFKINLEKCQLVEVNEFDIHKNFSFSAAKTPMKDLGIKQANNLFAYEIIRDINALENERINVNKFYYKRMGEQETKQGKNLVVGDWIDFKLHSNNEYTFAEILEIKQPEYKIRFLDENFIEKTINCREDSPAIGVFRANGHKEAAYLWNINNRQYNTELNDMTPFAIPLMVTVPAWLTWQELSLIIFNQLKRFIDFKYILKKISSSQPEKKEKKEQFSEHHRLNYHELKKIKENDPNRFKQIGEVHVAKSKSIVAKQSEEKEKKIKLISRDNDRTKEGFYEQLEKDNKLKEELEQEGFDPWIIETLINEQFDFEAFFESKEFPYKLRLMNVNTKDCMVCNKPLKAPKEIYIEKHINANPADIENCCYGCIGDFIDRPYIFDIKCATNLLICIDWIDELAFNNNSLKPQIDQSLIDTQEYEKDRKSKAQIDECLNLFVTDEKLNMTCDKCNQKGEHSIRTQIYKLPNILVIQLKRFYYNDGYIEKLDNFISVPLQGFNLKEWICEDSDFREDKDTYFDLYAVTNHIGNGERGHYTATMLLNANKDQKDVSIYDSKYNEWFHFNDHIVTYVEPNNVISEKSYILFFKKKEISTHTLIHMTQKEMNE